MAEKKKYFLIIIIFLMLAGIFLLPLVIRQIILPEAKAWEALEASLLDKETIIDAVIEGTIVYTLVSKEGRSDYGDFFVVFEQKAEKVWVRSYENDFKDLKPRLRLADVDGDGVVEILTAVSKTTHFDTEEKNRMFIFNYEDKKLVKKWTGSQIAGHWKDFIVGDLLPIPGSELIFIEQAESGKEQLCIYYWLDFGFLRLAEGDSYQNIREFSIIGENRIQITYDDNQDAVLSVQDGKIREAAPD